jgi:hypothetical protein
VTESPLGLTAPLTVSAESPSGWAEPVVTVGDPTGLEVPTTIDRPSVATHNDALAHDTALA